MQYVEKLNWILTLTEVIASHTPKTQYNILEMACFTSHCTGLAGNVDTTGYIPECMYS